MTFVCNSNSKMYSISLDPNTSQPNPVLQWWWESGWISRPVWVWSPQDWPCYYSERTYQMLPSLSRGWSWKQSSKASRAFWQAVSLASGRATGRYYSVELHDVAPAMNEDLEGNNWPKQIPVVCSYHFGLRFVSKANFSHSAWLTEEKVLFCKRHFCVLFFLTGMRSIYLKLPLLVNSLISQSKEN